MQESTSRLTRTLLPPAIQETIDARTEYTSDDIDGRSQHCINQYRIIEEIGRGSYGSVHRAVDQYCKEFVGGAVTRLAILGKLRR